MKRPPAPCRPSGIRRIAFIGALSLLVLVLAPAVPASATVFCTYNPATNTVTVTMGQDDPATILNSGGAILVDGVQCGSAAVANTVDITVFGDDGDEALTIDNSGGGFGSILFNIDLSVANDTLAIVGGSGGDTITVGSQSGQMNGSAMALIGFEALVLSGAGGADSLNATNANALTTVIGGAGADTLTGSSGNDVISGGTEDDVLVGNAGDDDLDGGSGTDVASYANAGGPVTIDLGAGTACCGAGFDLLTSIESAIGSPFGGGITGDGGNNVIAATSGNDELDGAGGNDTVDYSDASAGVTINLSLTTQQNTGGSGLDTLSNFENVTGSGFADTLLGTTGPNVLNGGGGLDTASYANAPGGVSVSLRADSASGAGGADTLTSIENATGSPFDDVISGDVGTNVMHGDAGTDTLDYSAAGTGSAAIAGPPTTGVAVDLSNPAPQPTGLDGTDTVDGFENLVGSPVDDSLSGDDGGNVLEGGTGDDALDGGPGSDVVSYEDAPDGVDADLSEGTATGGAGSDSVESFEGAIGSPFDDTIAGSDGDDALEGGPGSDAVSYEDAPGSVTIDLASGTATGSQGVDSVTGFERIVGGPADDFLGGNVFTNTIRGGAGDDEVLGRGGGDRLLGGAGADSVKGQGGPDRAIGGPGDDRLSGGADADELLGRAGFDLCVGGPATDSFRSCERRRS
jgi:Ca2+-binding RTX toxin-like protein